MAVAVEAAAEPEAEPVPEAPRLAPVPLPEPEPEPKPELPPAAGVIRGHRRAATPVEHLGSRACFPARHSGDDPIARRGADVPPHVPA